MQEWNRYEATKYAFLDFIGMKPAPAGAGGEVVKRGEIVLKEEMGYVDKLIGWIGRHPYLSALGLIGLFAGGVYASSDTVKNTVDKNYEKGSKFVKEKYASLGAAPAVVVPVVPAVNVSAVATPQVTETPQPSYDYYDNDFKVGIMIEGDAQFRQNVMNLIKTFKEVTPDDYSDLIKYAPKKIVKSRDRFNWYGWNSTEDEIGIT